MNKQDFIEAYCAQHFATKWNPRQREARMTKDQVIAAAENAYANKYDPLRLRVSAAVRAGGKAWGAVGVDRVYFNLVPFGRDGAGVYLDAKTGELHAMHHDSDVIAGVKAAVEERIAAAM